jgi:hypothetical protein
MQGGLSDSRGMLVDTQEYQVAIAWTAKREEDIMTEKGNGNVV